MNAKHPSHPSGVQWFPAEIGCPFFSPSMTRAFPNRVRGHHTPLSPAPSNRKGRQGGSIIAHIQATILTPCFSLTYFTAFALGNPPGVSFAIPHGTEPCTAAAVKCPFPNGVLRHLWQKMVTGICYDETGLLKEAHTPGRIA